MRGSCPPASLSCTRLCAGLRAKSLDYALGVMIVLGTISTIHGESSASKAQTHPGGCRRRGFCRCRCHCSSVSVGRVVTVVLYWHLEQQGLLLFVHGSCITRYVHQRLAAHPPKGPLAVEIMREIMRVQCPGHFCDGSWLPIFLAQKTTSNVLQPSQPMMRA